MQRCALVNNASNVLIENSVACISQFTFLVIRYVVTVVVCRCVLFDASMTFFVF